MLKIILAHYKFLNLLLNLIQKLLFKKLPVNKKNIVKKILIFRNGSFGDTLCALPAINSISKHFPDAQIDILTNSGGSSLVSIENIIDKKIIHEFINYLGANKKILAKKIQNKKYDLFIELPQDQASLISQIRNMVIVRLIFKINYGFGWEMGATKFLKKQQEKLFTFKDERKRLLDILKKNNLVTLNQEYPLNITQNDIDAVSELILKNNISDKHKNIALIVGAKRNSNRWPIENFREVAKYLYEQGFNTIIVGGKEDNALAEKLLDIPNTYNFTGMFTPLQSAIMLSQCKLTISNDTGPMHLSYAIGTPVVAIFSARDYPDKWFPPKENIALRNNNIECSVCFTESCSDNKCMKTISSKTVIKSFEKLLQTNKYQL